MPTVPERKAVAYSIFLAWIFGYSFHCAETLWAVSFNLIMCPYLLLWAHYILRAFPETKKTKRRKKRWNKK